MNLTVYIGSPDVKNRRVINESSLIKKGGNGSAYLLDSTTVLKIFHDYNPAHVQKLQRLMARIEQIQRKGDSLPEEAVAPRQLSFNESGLVNGLTMDFLGAGNEPMWQFVQDNYRRTFRVTPVTVVEVFVEGIPVMGKLHQLGFCVGDHNYRNTFHALRSQMILRPKWKVIDFDSVAFDEFGSEGDRLFLAPELHGQDLTKPIFKPGHDWLSFSIMLFYCMTGAHPFAGYHPKFRSLETRMQQGMSVFNSEVTYPDDSVPLAEAMTPDLQDVLVGYFEDGVREPFPAEALTQYIEEKTGKRVSIPTKVPAGFNKPKEKPQIVTASPSSNIVKLLETAGSILYSTVIGEELLAIVDEANANFLYQVNLASSFDAALRVERTQLPDFPIGSRFGLFKGSNEAMQSQTYIVVNPPYSEDLDVYQVVAGGLKALNLEIRTSPFLGTGKAIFRTSNNALYTMISSDLFCIQVQRGQIRRTPVRPLRRQQTWFAVDAASADPRIFAFYNKFDEQVYLLIDGSKAYNVAMPELDRGETQQDITVKFATDGVLVIQLTEKAGEEYIRVTVLDSQGEIRYAAVPVSRSSNFYREIHGKIYRTTRDAQDGGRLIDLILHPVNGQIEQERLQQNRIKQIPVDGNIVHERVTLMSFVVASKKQAGIIVVDQNTICRIG